VPGSVVGAVDVEVPIPAFVAHQARRAGVLGEQRVETARGAPSIGLDQHGSQRLAHRRDRLDVGRREPRTALAVLFERRR